LAEEGENLSTPTTTVTPINIDEIGTKMEELHYGSHQFQFNLVTSPFIKSKDFFLLLF